MSRNYDFANLGWQEFEQLVCELIGLKISEETQKVIFFNRFKEGADKGIDGLYMSQDTRLVLQAKNVSTFQSLYRKLKQADVPNMRILKPERYILVTSVALTQDQTEKIHTLFKPYMVSVNDVIGRETLNDLINRFPKVELHYPKLYLQGFDILNYILHHRIDTQSKAKIQEFKKIVKYYVKDQNFNKALEILGKSHFVVLSGEPGIGKSTLGGMLSLHLIDKESCDFIFIRRSISEAEDLWEDEKQQVFLFDDFLGSITFQDFGRNEDRQLLDFIRRITDSKNKYLIVTTREYIFKYAEHKYNELKEIGFTRCILKQTSQTPEFKAHILGNYLHHSDCDYKNLDLVLYEDHFKTLIYHRNFTPRIISEYMYKYRPRHSKYYLFSELEKNLDDPYVYWRSRFLELSSAAQMVLLVLAISSEPMSYELLQVTYKNAGKFRKLYERGYEKESFAQALNELSDSFISVTHNPIRDKKDSGSISLKDYSLIFDPLRDSKMIEFQNPSIKDFTLEYLRTEKHIIELLIKSAITFNQLFFVFTTKISDDFVHDDESEHPFYSKKILLEDYLLDVLKTKIIREFEKLSMISIEKIHWEGGDVSYHFKTEDADNRLLKLKQLNYYFDLSHETDIRTLVIDTYNKYVADDQAEVEMLSHAERLEQPVLVKILRPYISFDGATTIKDYYNNIRFTDEFISLMDFEDMFPKEYIKFLKTTGKRKLNQNITATIYDDVDYFMWEGTIHAERALDELIDETIPTLEEAFGLKLSSRFKKDVNEMSGRNLFWVDKKVNKGDEESISAEANHSGDDDLEKRSSPTENRPDRIKELIKTINRQLLPGTRSFDDDQDAKDYVERTMQDPKASEILLESLWNGSSPFYSYRYQSAVIDMIIKYYYAFQNLPNAKNDLFFFIFQSTGLSTTDRNNSVFLAFKIFQQYVEFFKEEHTQELLKNELTSHAITLLLAKLEESGILLKDNGWYSFACSDIRDECAVQYMLELPKPERAELYKSIANYDYYGEDWDYLWTAFSTRDKETFRDAFWLSELKEYWMLLSANASQGICFSYFKQAGLGIDLYLDEDQLEFLGATFGMARFEDLCRFFDIPLNGDDITDHFLDNSSAKESILKYLNKHCKNENGNFTINFEREINNSEFIILIEQIGLKEYIESGIQKLQDKITECNPV